jgi:type II secretory pathway pseudopilin PulG
MRPKPQSVNRLRVGRLRHRRAATTLVEVLVGITLVSLLLSIVGTVAVRLRQWDRQMRDRSQYGDQFVKLSESMRADIRRATGVTQPDKKTIAITTSDYREIRYELMADGCRRTVKSSDKPFPAADTFAIGAGQFWRLEIAAPGRRPAYTVVLESSDSNHADSVPAPFFVYAALGADTP